MRFFLFVCIIMVSLCSEAQQNAKKQIVPEFKGQFSAWTHYNKANDYPLYLGGRLIPQANLEINLNKDLIDFEASANIVGDLGLHMPDSSQWNDKLSAYRLWGRYSSDQFELRVGLQKINFGSATLLRPLMWFDQVDPRDPLQLTDGVWGALGRYYFMNNANIWLWSLYCNSNLKGWEQIKSDKTIPEFGGRFQLPVWTGDIALSYHHRTLEISQFVVTEDKVGESRYGLDARFDKLLGFWSEAVWVHKEQDIGLLTNQMLFNWGLDYTFGLGNGLNVLAEHLLASYDKQAFAFDNVNNMTAVAFNYPIGMFDNLNTIVFYSWEQKQLYNFINWSKQFNNIDLNIMGYWNPDDYNMPMQSQAENLFAGKGLQFLFVYNF